LTSQFRSKVTDLRSFCLIVIVKRNIKIPDKVKYITQKIKDKNRGIITDILLETIPNVKHKLKTEFDTRNEVYEFVIGISWS